MGAAKDGGKMGFPQVRLGPPLRLIAETLASRNVDVQQIFVYLVSWVRKLGTAWDSLVGAATHYETIFFGAILTCILLGVEGAIDRVRERH